MDKKAVFGSLVNKGGKVGAGTVIVVLGWFIDEKIDQFEEKLNRIETILIGLKINHNHKE